MTNIQQITAQEEVQEQWIEWLQKMENVPILLITVVEGNDGTLESTVQVPSYVSGELLIEALESAIADVRKDMECK